MVDKVSVTGLVKCQINIIFLSEYSRPLTKRDKVKDNAVGGTEKVLP
jgi:hypothetical protein